MDNGLMPEWKPPISATTLATFKELAIGDVFLYPSKLASVSHQPMRETYLYIKIDEKYTRVFGKGIHHHADPDSPVIMLNTFMIKLNDGLVFENYLEQREKEMEELRKEQQEYLARIKAGEEIEPFPLRD